jgi:hypothetical protein
MTHNQGKKIRKPHGAPRRPEVIFDIIGGRDIEKKTLAQLGAEIGMTRAGVRHLYLKWHDWFYENYEWPTEDAPSLDQTAQKEPAVQEERVEG